MSDLNETPSANSQHSNDNRLDLESKLFQRSIWPEVQKAAQGDALNRPLVVELDPTTFCDAACPECISSRLLNQGGFSKERLIELAQEIISLGVKAVILIGGGEPLAHPGTRDVLRLLGQAGVALGVTTNGTLIDRHLEELSLYADWVRVSVDAGSHEVYEVFRPHRSGKNYFQTVIDNMKALARLKKRELGYSFLVMSRIDEHGNINSTNVHDIYKAGELAKHIGCDYFEIKPMYDMAHYLIKPPPEVLDSLRKQLQTVKKLETCDFHIIGPHNLDEVLKRETLLEPKTYSQCPVAELRTLITPAGAYICPYFRGDEGRSYGDLKTSTLHDIWHSEKRRLVKANTRPNRDCHFHCIRHASNLKLLEVGERPQTFMPVDDFDFFI